MTFLVKSHDGSGRGRHERQYATPSYCSYITWQEGQARRCVWTVSFSGAWHSPRSSSHNASTSRQRMYGNSFRVESSDLRAENASQDAYGSMDVRLHRSDRLVKNFGDLGVAASFDEAQSGGSTQMHRQLKQCTLHERDLGVLLDDSLGLRRPFVRFA